MPCVHLKKLYQFCQDESVKIGGSDLLRIVCEQCGVQEECPSMLMEHYETKEAQTAATRIAEESSNEN